jgi:hypothetical protein
LDKPWPDWSGETAIVVGTGPSAAQAPLALAQGRNRIFAIKSSWRLAPFADALYGLDKGWWIANQGAHKFKGLKFSPSPTICRVYPDIRYVRLRPFARILNDETGVIGCGLRTGGGHSGFQAINLSVQFGARRILLVGFEMTLARGAHWKNDDRGVGKPDAGRTASWREAMDECAGQFRDLGVDVISCTPGSALTAYPKMSLHEALA